MVTEEAVVVDEVADEAAVDVEGGWLAALGSVILFFRFGRRTLLLPFCTIGLESSIL